MKGVFRTNGFALELADYVQMEQEVIENLDGQKIVCKEAEENGYLYVSFPGYYDCNGGVLTMYLKEEHVEYDQVEFEKRKVANQLKRHLDDSVDNHTVLTSQMLEEMVIICQDLIKSDF